MFLLESFIRQVIALCNLLQISSSGRGINDKLESHVEAEEGEVEGLQKDLGDTMESFTYSAKL